MRTGDPTTTGAVGGMAGAKVGGEGGGLGGTSGGGGGGIMVFSGGGVVGGGGTCDPAGAAGTGASTGVGTGIGTDIGGTGRKANGLNKYRFPQCSHMRGAGSGSRTFRGFCSRLRSMLARSGTWRPIM